MGNRICLRQADGGKGLGEAGESHFRHMKWEVGSECQVEVRSLDRLPVQFWELDQVETICSLLADRGVALSFCHLFRLASSKSLFPSSQGVLGVKNRSRPHPRSAPDIGCDEYLMSALKSGGFSEF